MKLFEVKRLPKLKPHAGPLDRKLRSGELELLAAGFAVSNMGFADMWAVDGSKPGEIHTKFCVGHERDRHPWAEVIINDGCEEECQQESGGILQQAMNFAAGEVDDSEKYVMREYKSWLKDLKKYTVAKIGQTWKELKPVTDKMMTY